MTDVPGARPARPGVSLTTLVVVAALLLGAGGAVWLGQRGAATRQVVVAGRDLPAFAAVAAADVALAPVARSAVPRGAAQSPAAVVGRYLLHPVKAGQAVAADAIGPPAAAGTTVVGLPLDTAGPGGVGAGDRADLLLAPSAAGTAPVVVPEVLVVDVRGPAAGTIVFLAVPRDRERDIAGVAGRGRAILTTASPGP
jgi:Flp pilus assembly protein CpaB